MKRLSKIYSPEKRDQYGLQTKEERWVVAGRLKEIEIWGRELRDGKIYFWGFLSVSLRDLMRLFDIQPTKLDKENKILTLGLLKRT